MPLVKLRKQFGISAQDDIEVSISDKTFDYLLTLPVPQARVSTYLDRDWPRIEASYEELYIGESCAFQFKVTQVIPGSKTRWSVTLPDEMKEGEQLTVLVDRKTNAVGFAE